MTSILLCVSVLVAVAGGDAPPPLTKDKIAKLQQLVRRTQERDAELKAALERQQNRLMKAYASFLLDEKHILELHTEIIQLQTKLLTNYRDLQVELRNIVGEKRFRHLKTRIDLILKGKKKVKAPADASAGD